MRLILTTIAILLVLVIVMLYDIRKQQSFEANQRAKSAEYHAWLATYDPDSFANKAAKDAYDLWAIDQINSAPQRKPQACPAPSMELVLPPQAQLGTRTETARAPREGRTVTLGEQHL